MRKPHISIVSPVYKGEKLVPLLVERLELSLHRITNDYEIILVEDGSTPESWASIQDICSRHEKVIGIELSRNFGQHHAISAGLDYSKGDWVVVMDCDLQDRPEEIPNFYKKAQEGYDIVLGRRVHRKDAFLKKLLSKVFFKILNYLTGLKYDGAVANFGMYNRKSIDAINQMREHIRAFPFMVQWVGFRQTKVDVQHDERASGSSSYHFFELLSLALNTMLSYSDKPIRLAMQFGALIALSSFVYAILVLYRYFAGEILVPGYASLIVSIWFFSGCLMMALGVVGMYVGKTFAATKQRPIYIVRTIVKTPVSKTSNA